MDLIALILSIYLFVKLSELQTKVSNLEKREQVTKESVTGQLSEVSPIIPPDKLYQDQSFVSDSDYNQLKTKISPPDNQASENSFSLISWIKQDFMVKLGGFLLLIALGWFVSYAFANNWIGPAGRVTLGILFGVLMLLLGIWRMQESRHQGGIFTVVGSTTILFTVFAAREMYDFFTPVSALFVMFMTVAFVAFVSVRYNSERLAMAGLLLSGFAPTLTNAPLWDPIVVFSYLLMVVAGTLWVVWFTGWTKLTFVSLVITYLYSLSFLYTDNQDAVLTYSFLFVLVFFVANVVSLMRRRDDDKHLGIHALTALGTAMFLFTWIESAAVEEWKSLLYTAWALVFAFGTYAAFKFTANYRAFYLYGATAVALIGMATAAELEGPVLVIAYIVEITVLIMATTKITYQAKLLAYQSLLYIIPGILSLESIASWSRANDYRIFGSNEYGIFHSDFVVVTLMIIALGVVAMIIHTRRNDQDSGLVRFVSGLLYFGFGFYTITWIWLTTHSLFEEGIATLLSVVVYTVVGIKFFNYGRGHNITAFKIVGASLVGISLLFLFTTVMALSIEFRIIIFLIIGVLLTSTAFMAKNKNKSDVE